MNYFSNNRISLTTTITITRTFIQIITINLINNIITNNRSDNKWIFYEILEINEINAYVVILVYYRTKTIFFSYYKTIYGEIINRIDSGLFTFKKEKKNMPIKYIKFLFIFWLSQAC